MAHKKGGGSSTNGRDSNAQRLGVKAFAGQWSPAAPSSRGSAAPASSPASMSASAPTTRSSPRFPAAWCSLTAEIAGASRPSSPPPNNRRNILALALSRSIRTLSQQIKKATATAAAFVFLIPIPVSVFTSPTRAPSYSVPALSQPRAPHPRGRSCWRAAARPPGAGVAQCRSDFVPAVDGRARRHQNRLAAGSGRMQ
jgi:hypothetical protein